MGINLCSLLTALSPYPQSTPADYSLYFPKKAEGFGSLQEEFYYRDNTLVVLLAGQWYCVDKVQVDELGVYVEKTALTEERKIWYCPQGHPNPLWASTCAACQNGG